MQLRCITNQSAHTY